MGGLFLGVCSKVMFGISRIKLCFGWGFYEKTQSYKVQNLFGIPTSNLGIEKVWPHDRQPDSQHPCTPLGVPSKRSFMSPGMTPVNSPPTPKAPSVGPPVNSQQASPQHVGSIPTPKASPSMASPQEDIVPAAQVARDTEPMLPPTPSLSQGAIDRRVRRAMEPNAKGQFKVSQEIRKLWDEGNKDKVFKLFADCGHDTDVFIKRFSVRKDHEKEFEVGTYFTFQTEEQLAEKPEKLFRMFASPNVTWTNGIYMLTKYKKRLLFGTCPGKRGTTSLPVPKQIQRKWWGPGIPYRGISNLYNLDITLCVYIHKKSWIDNLSL